MSQNIDQWFIDIFVNEVHHAYQREGARLENTVRQDGQGPGKRVWFPKLGVSKVVQKGRHAQVPIQERDESGVWCNIHDWYTGDMVDSLDEFKTNVNARQEYTSSQGFALGRKSDQIILDAMDAATQGSTGAGNAITLAMVNEGYTYLGNNGVPADNYRFFAVSPKGWTDLMAIPEFSNADYVPESEMPFKGASGTMKRWFSFYCFTQEGADSHDGSLKKTGDVRQSMMYHRRSVGYHRQSGPGIKSDWENLHQGHSIVGAMSSGAILIDDLGVYKINHDETVLPS